MGIFHDRRQLATGLLFCLSTLLSGPLLAQSSPTPPAPIAPLTLEQLKAGVEQVRKQHGTPAVGIALVNKDGPYWVAGLGEARPESHLKADENTLFRLASASKIFVGLAVMKLVEDGKLHLDDKVQTLAPEIAYKNRWEAQHPVLLAHLLEHTTGWDDMHPAEFAYNKSDTMSMKDALAYHPDSRVSRWIPGTRMAYCSTGTVVAAYIVEKVSGQKFEDYVQQNFFAPLQMNSSTYYENAAVKQRGATLHSDGVPQKYEYHLYRPDGALNASAKEMANLLQFLINKGQFQQKQILTPASLERMQHARTTLGAKQGLLGGHGLASMTTGFGDKQIAFYGHAGRVVGGVVDVYYSPQLQQGFAIMLSNDDYATLDGIEALVLKFMQQDATPKARPAVPLAPAFANLDGWYRRINPRNEILRYIDDASSLTRFDVVGNTLERGGLLGGVERDTAFSDKLLQDANTGLPSVAMVNDPLAGEAVQVRSHLYQRVPTPLVLGLLGLFGLWLVFVLLNVLMVVSLVPRSIWGKPDPARNLPLQILPLLATVLYLLTKFAGDIFGDTSVDWGTISATSLTAMICSIGYALVTLACLWLSVKQIRVAPLRYWHASALSLLHGAMVVYLLSYGIIGVRSWA